MIQSGLALSMWTLDALYHVFCFVEGEARFNVFQCCKFWNEVAEWSICPTQHDVYTAMENRNMRKLILLRNHRYMTHKKWLQLIQACTKQFSSISPPKVDELFNFMSRETGWKNEKWRSNIVWTKSADEITG